jgi:hypothetical protein
MIICVISLFSFFGSRETTVQKLYFCLEGSHAIIREWTSVPRIGDTIALPELGGNLNPLRVYD